MNIFGKGKDKKDSEVKADTKKDSAKTDSKKDSEPKKDSEVKKTVKRYPVPSFANKARVFHSLDAIIDVDLCPSLNDYLRELKKFIDVRCK